MEKAIKEGVTKPYYSTWKKVLKYNGETVEVTYTYVDGIRRISDAWVVK